MSWNGPRGVVGPQGIPDGTFVPIDELRLQAPAVFEIARAKAKLEIEMEQDRISWGVITGQFIPWDEKRHE